MPVPAEVAEEAEAESEAGVVVAEPEVVEAEVVEAEVVEAEVVVVVAAAGVEVEVEEVVVAAEAAGEVPPCRGGGRRCRGRECSERTPSAASS